MRRTALLAVPVAAVIVAVLGVAQGWWTGEPPDPLPADEPIHWVNTTLWEKFTLWVPEPWSKNYKFTHPEYVHFSGPQDDNFLPQLQILWRKKEMKAKDWADWNVRKFREHPGAETFDDGDATVADMPARFLIYRQKGPDGREYQTIDFYFAGHGHVGMLRGVSTARTFLDTYRWLFTEIAHRLRHRG